MDHKLLEYIIQRVEHIDKKVDSLLKFKWQIMGGAIAGSAILTILFQVILFLGHTK